MRHWAYCVPERVDLLEGIWFTLDHLVLQTVRPGDEHRTLQRKAAVSRVTPQTRMLTGDSMLAAAKLIKLNIDLAHARHIPVLRFVRRSEPREPYQPSIYQVSLKSALGELSHSR